MTIFKYLFSFSRASVVENGRKHTHTAFSRWRMETRKLKAIRYVI